MDHRDPRAGSGYPECAHIATHWRRHAHKSKMRTSTLILFSAVGGVCSAGESSLRRLQATSSGARRCNPSTISWAQYELLEGFVAHQHGFDHLLPEDHAYRYEEAVSGAGSG